LATYYFSLAASSLFVPSFVVSRLGSKLTLIAAFGVHLVYMLANFLPQYYSLIPASVLAGVAASCMWQGIFLKIFLFLCLFSEQCLYQPVRN
jgi:uncharacterized membrane protein